MENDLCEKKEWMRSLEDSDPFLSSRPTAIGLYGNVRRLQVKFLSTVEADLVCALFDCKYAADVMMPAAKDKLE